MPTESVERRLEGVRSQENLLDSLVAVPGVAQSTEQSGVSPLSPPLRASQLDSKISPLWPETDVGATEPLLDEELPSASTAAPKSLSQSPDKPSKCYPTSEKPLAYPVSSEDLTAPPTSFAENHLPISIEDLTTPLTSISESQLPVTNEDLTAPVTTVSKNSFSAEDLTASVSSATENPLPVSTEHPASETSVSKSSLPSPTKEATSDHSLAPLTSVFKNPLPVNTCENLLSSQTPVSKTTSPGTEDLSVSVTSISKSTLPTEDQTIDHVLAPLTSISKNPLPVPVTTELPASQASISKSSLPSKEPSTHTSVSKNPLEDQLLLTTGSQLVLPVAIEQSLEPTPTSKSPAHTTELPSVVSNSSSAAGPPQDFSPDTSLLSPHSSETPRTKSPITVQQWVDSLPPEPPRTEEDVTTVVVQEVKNLDAELENLTLGAEAAVVCRPLLPFPAHITPSGGAICGSDAGSHCSSMESFLESRRPDPEELLLELGFGGPDAHVDNLSRIPARFLQPSHLKGVNIEKFLRHQQEVADTINSSFNGYRGLTARGHEKPSVIVGKIMERLREAEAVGRRRQEAAVHPPRLASVARNLLTRLRVGGDEDAGKREERRGRPGRSLGRSRSEPGLGRTASPLRRPSDPAPTPQPTPQVRLELEYEALKTLSTHLPQESPSCVPTFDQYMQLSPTEREEVKVGAVSAGLGVYCKRAGQTSPLSSLATTKANSLANLLASSPPSSRLLSLVTQVTLLLEQQASQDSKS